jgi:hypothetical protein
VEQRHVSTLTLPLPKTVLPPINNNNNNNTTKHILSQQKAWYFTKLYLVGFEKKF